jgi:hypothetical protein
MMSNSDLSEAEEFRSRLANMRRDDGGETF